MALTASSCLFKIAINIGVNRYELLTISSPLPILSGNVVAMFGFAPHSSNRLIRFTKPRSHATCSALSPCNKSHSLSTCYLSRKQSNIYEQIKHNMNKNNSLLRNLNVKITV